MFNEAPKFIRGIQGSETLQRGIQQGIKLGLEAIAGSAGDEAPALTAGRPVTDNSVPTAHRARRLVYAPDLDGRADPGEIVWTWVVYEDDPTRGKDRPVLVVGRDRRTLLGLMLSSRSTTAMTRTGSALAVAAGTTRAGPAGCAWTGCWTCPKRAFGAKARSLSARCSKSLPPGCAPSTPGVNAALRRRLGRLRFRLSAVQQVKLTGNPRQLLVSSSADRSHCDEPVSAAITAVAAGRWVSRGRSTRDAVARPSRRRCRSSARTPTSPSGRSTRSVGASCLSISGAVRRGLNGFDQVGRPT